MDGVISTLPIIVADLFGRAAFPSVLRYVSLFLLSLLVLLAFGFVATIPFLGPVLASFLSFYPMVVLAKLFGEMCGR